MRLTTPCSMARLVATSAAALGPKTLARVGALAARSNCEPTLLSSASLLPRECGAVPGFIGLALLFYLYQPDSGILKLGNSSGFLREPWLVTLPLPWRTI